MEQPKSTQPYRPTRCPSLNYTIGKTGEFISAIVIRRSIGLFLRGGDDKKLFGGHHGAVDDLDNAADGKQVKSKPSDPFSNLAETEL